MVGGWFVVTLLWVEGKQICLYLRTLCQELGESSRRDNIVLNKVGGWLRNDSAVARLAFEVHPVCWELRGA